MQNINTLESSSSVSFPLSEFSLYPASNVYYNASRPTHLPFRRISIPSAPNLLHRQSVVSMASFDSLPEERSPSSPAALMKNGPGRLKGQPNSFDNKPRRYSRRKEARPVDEARESKRLKIVHEFHDTERAYVEGLDLIYSHFLTPMIASLDASHPLLSRAELTSIFSNFIDIWNFHRSFYSSLSTLLNLSTSSLCSPPPALSPLLLSHFPYLSLYSPFVTSFPVAMSSLTSVVAKNSSFASFIAQQEADPRCRKLKFRDWLLTIVQRCPRYLLLLKDLITCTELDDLEHAQLTAVHTLVSKITVSLNTSLHTHSQTMSLISLQRNTSNLPFQLITPGRTFLKRGSLLQLERSSVPMERDFLLFSDCLIWIASAERSNGELEDWAWGGIVDKGQRKSVGVTGEGRTPPTTQTRSKSNSELSSSVHDGNDCTPRSGSAPLPICSKPSSPSSPPKKVKHASVEEKWIYKGKVELVDLEVVITPPRKDGQERRFDLLSPEVSFPVYAVNEEERDAWISAIRDAKASLLVSLNAMHPNSTLTSSSSTHHLRQSLQALPHSPENEHRKPKRGKVDHFVPAIWIPDAKTASCMRCGRTFGWRRRRHHCRLCGRCVCANCSNKTFFISDSTSKNATKSARSCNPCYDTVFPLLDSSTHEEDTPTSASNSTLTGFPSWLSMPSFVLPTHSSTPDALMAIDVESPIRELHRIDDREDGNNDEDDIFVDAGGRAGTPTPQVRTKLLATRSRSYHQILEDFPGLNQGLASFNVSDASLISPHEDKIHRLQLQTDLEIESIPPETRVDTHPSTPSKKEALSSKEDTARRHKRFSLPALAIQMTPVTARPGTTGEGRSKRLPLTPSGRSDGRQVQNEIRDRDGKSCVSGRDELSRGMAVVKLSELLVRPSPR